MPPDAADPLFDEVLTRLPLAASPDQLERLVVLGLRMVLRRDEDKSQLDRLTQAVHELIGQAHQMPDLHHIGEECAKILEAANQSRLSRAVVLHPAERARVEQEKEEQAATPRVSTPGKRMAALMILLAALLFAPMAAVAIDPSLAPESWRSQPVKRLTPVQLAREIADLPAGDGAELTEQGIATHLLRLIDDRPLVVVDNLPRRLCPKTAALLAKQGEVTLFGQTAPDAHPSTLASLCHKENGDARMMWSPSSPR